MSEVPHEPTDEPATGGPRNEEPPRQHDGPFASSDAPRGPFEAQPTPEQRTPDYAAHAPTPEASRQLPPSPTEPLPDEPVAPIARPASAAAGPFDQLFEELGTPPTPVASSSSAWHAAWGAQPSSHTPEATPTSPLLRPDDSPFATVAAAPAGATYQPGVYGPPPVAPPQERRSIIRPAGRLLRELAETVVLALAIFLLVRAVVQNFQVEGKSMEPTLETRWYLLVDKAIYWEVNMKTVSKFVPFVDAGHDPTRYLFRGPKRGDVIVFRQPNQPIGAPERDFIKRVIGLPGDVVEVHNGTVYINGKPLHEPYIAEKPAYDCPAQRIPAGHYWVLGDNRNNSSDSHSWGPVPKANIIGQAWLIYWPFHQIGLVNNKHARPDATEPEQVQPPKDNVPFATANRDCSTVTPAT